MFCGILISNPERMLYTGSVESTFEQAEFKLRRLLDSKGQSLAKIWVLNLEKPDYVGFVKYLESVNLCLEDSKIQAQVNEIIKRIKSEK